MIINMILLWKKKEKKIIFLIYFWEYGMLVEECEVLLEVKVLVHVPHGRAEAVVVLKDRKTEG